MLKLYYVLLTFVVFVNSAKKDENADETSTKSTKKSKKSSKTSSNIDVSDLEGEWDTTYYFNHTVSKIVARKCDNQEGLTWSISGTQWTQNSDNSNQKKDLIFNSNGRWTIKEVVKTDDINFVKTELMKDSTETIEPCFAYMRDNDKLYTMLNYTNPETCPQKFIFFDGVCSNTIDYTVSTCTGGKCAKKEKDTSEEVSSAFFTSFSSIVALSSVSLFLTRQ